MRSNSHRTLSAPWTIIAAIAIIAAIPGCAVLETEPRQDARRSSDPAYGRTQPTIAKVFSVSSEDTRTSLNGTSVTFSKGEAISIYDGTSNRKYTADGSGSSVTFSGSVSATATEFYALTPYSSSTTFKKSGATVTAYSKLPSTQEATSGSFATGTNIAAAKTGSAGNFTFQNMMSLAKLTLKSSNLDGHKITSIKMTAATPLAGDVKITFGETCSASAGSSTINSVILTHSNGSAFSDGTYYFVLLPGNAGSIILEFSDSEGNIATKTASLRSGFEAGVIKNLGTVKGLSWKKDPNIPGGWLELPSYSKSSIGSTTTSSLSDLYYLQHSSGQRNYTALYDPEMYASYWVAYPLCSSHSGSASNKNWSYNPDVPKDKQTNLVSGSYGVEISTENYSSNLYSRGHQIPAADRDGSSGMLAQTYYVTNSTPQIQNGFNSGIWSDLENAIRNVASKTDTVYVISGAAFRTKGGSEEIKTITNKQDSKTIPVPNYYWKALLKVSWSGNRVTAAKAIGFWMPHADLKGKSYANYAVSVKTIESYTGLDIFTNLPDSIESEAENNSNWQTFQNF